MNQSTIQMLAEVAIAAVGENDHKISAVACKCKLLGRSQCRTGGRTGENTFLSRQLPRAVEGLGISDLYHLIHKRHIHGIRDKVIANALNVIVAMFSAAHRRSNRISQNALYLRILLLKILHDAGIGAAAACSGNQEVNLSVQIPIYFRPGGLIMNMGISRIHKLPQ